VLNWKNGGDGDFGQLYAFSVASPGFVARRGMGHSRWTSGPGAAAAR